MPRTLVPIFFLSGAASLVFEALWFRLAGLSLGNSVWSASLVLAAFMGGLSLGNTLIARVYHRIARPIRLYAYLEIAIGIGGFAVVLALPRLAAFFGPLFASLVDTPWLLNVVRLGIAFTVLLIPATAMGATLPVVTGALSRVNPNFGASFSKLYGWNTLGAMLGAIVAEAVLVGWFGIIGTGLVAISLNLIAGVIALRLSDTHEPAAPPLVAPAIGLAPTRWSPRVYRYLVVGFLSGAVMLALEVVGFRFLLLTYTGTGLVFAVMLAVVLAGIGLGGLVASRFARYDEHYHRWLPHVTTLSGALVVLSYYGFDLFTVWQIEHRPTFAEFIAFTLFLLLPVATLSGVAFTMVVRAVKDELGSSIRTAGVSALWNTVGAMLGSLGAGFLLLPLAGMELSFFILAATYFATAFLVPTPDVPPHRWTRVSGRAAITATAACLALFPFGLMRDSFFVIVQRSLPEHELIETREGLTETIRYYRRDFFGLPRSYRLVTDSYSMSGTATLGKRYMKLYVYLPLALRADTRDALLISFGVGSTAKALTDTQSLEHIDVVDISRDILEMSSIVYSDADNPLHDSRVNVHVEDGRFFLSTTTRKYDLITSEPPPPKVAGVVNLYSEEYFRLIRAHLNPGGYVSYWLPVHQLQPLDTLGIIKGFCNAFDDCSLWSGGGLEWMLLGSNAASGGVSADDFSAQWRDSRVGAELAAVGFEVPEQMGSLFMADADQLVALTESVLPITDNHPRRLSSRLVTDHLPVPLYADLMNEDRRRERFLASDFIARTWPPELVERSVPFFRYERMIKNHFTNDLYREASDPFLWEAIDEVLKQSSLETLPLWLLGSDADVQRIAAELTEGAIAPVEADLDRAVGFLSRRDYANALHYTKRYVTNRELTVGTFSLLVYVLAKNDELDEAQRIIRQADRANGAVDSFLDWFELAFPVDTAHVSVLTESAQADTPRRLE